MQKQDAQPRTMTRAMAVQSVRARLLRQGFPRVQMLILVSLTGLAGFGASVAMLSAGIHGIALRYMLATGAAYIAFLLLLWLWLRTSATDYIDSLSQTGFGDGSNGVESCGSGELSSDVAGGGGNFDGGGASGNVDFGTDGISPGKTPLDAIGKADEGVIDLTVFFFVLVFALSCLFVIWSAPLLFAEVLVDALLAAGLYRRLRVLNPRHWVVAALKHTLIPFILTAAGMGAVGWAMQSYMPDAKSLGDVLSSRWSQHAGNAGSKRQGQSLHHVHAYQPPRLDHPG